MFHWDVRWVWTWTLNVDPDRVSVDPDRVFVDSQITIKTSMKTFVLLDDALRAREASVTDSNSKAEKWKLVVFRCDYSFCRLWSSELPSVSRSVSRVSCLLFFSRPSTSRCFAPLSLSSVVTVFSLLRRWKQPKFNTLQYFRTENTNSLCVSLCLPSQKVSEKVGGAEGTKLDDEFKEMEKVKIRDIHKHKYSRPDVSVLEDVFHFIHSLLWTIEFNSFIISHDRL